MYAIFVVATGFFWFGSAYFSYNEVLKIRFDPETASVLTTSLTYGAQMLGILLYVWIAARSKKRAESKFMMSLSFALSAAGILGSFITSNVAVIILSGVLFNLFGTNGLLLGCQLRFITEKLPQRFYGRAFGLGYAVGSLGTALLAFVFGGRCPIGYTAVIVYIPFVLLNFISILFKDRFTKESMETALPEHTEKGAPTAAKPVGKNLLLLFVSVILIMGILDAISGLMKTAYLDTSNQVNTVYARIFYAIGLIPAGVLIDYSRRKGAIACLITRGFSFFLILLALTPMRGFEAVALFYLLSGFFTVYRTVTAMDIARKTPKLFYFVVFGILFGRLGEVIVTLPYSFIPMDLLTEILTVSVLFVILLLMFFPFLKKLYDPVPPEPVFSKPEQTLDELIVIYGITEREAEALRLLLDNKNTSDIAAAMVVTEGTVYKYISSMITKTGAKNRLDLILRLAGKKN